MSTSLVLDAGLLADYSATRTMSYTTSSISGDYQEDDLEDEFDNGTASSTVSDDECPVLSIRRKSLVSLPDGIIDCTRLPVSDRPPSSASSVDSGFGGVTGSGSPIDVSSDEDQTGCSDEDCCTCLLNDSRVEECRWNTPISSSIPPTTSPRVKLRRVISILHPPSTNSLRSEIVFGVDLTERTDVTYTIESLLPLPGNATTVSSNAVAREVVAMTSDTVAENGVDDVVNAVELSADFVQTPLSEKSNDNKSAGSSGAAATERSHRPRRAFNANFLRPWTLSAMMTSLVPGFMMVPPPLNYVVLKPVNGSAPVPGEYYVLPNGVTVDARRMVNIVPAAVLKSTGYEYDRTQWAPFASKWSAPVKQRKWVTVDKSVARGPTVALRVMTYNVLAKNLATPERFRYCPEWVLDWDHRKTLLLGEIVSKNADVVALQEVELREYVTFFQPKLAESGYTGVFALKSRARTKSSDEQLDVDGCAIFYKSNKFQAVSSHVIEFNNLALRAAVGCGVGDESLDFVHRVMSKDNVGLAVLLQTTHDAWSDTEHSKSTTTNSEPILVATAHLFWDPGYPDVKLIQTMLLTHELQRIAAATPPHLMTSHLPPLVLVGDFNALPDSGVLSFLRDGQIRSTHADFCGRDYTSCLRKLDGSSSSSKNSGKDEGDATADNSVTYRHSLGLQAVNCRAEFTNCTYWFRGVIDHILYSTESNIRAVRVLQGLPSVWLRENGIIGLPTASIPSDHIPVVVDFVLTPRCAKISDTPGRPEVQRRTRL